MSFNAQHNVEIPNMELGIAFKAGGFGVD